MKSQNTLMDQDILDVIHRIEFVYEGISVRVLYFCHTDTYYIIIPREILLSDDFITLSLQIEEKSYLDEDAAVNYLFVEKVAHEEAMKQVYMSYVLVQV
jgi:hypothetical protein